MKNILQLFFIINLFLLSNLIFACSPAPGWPDTPENNFKKHDVVFVGKVLESKIYEDKQQIEIVFNVEKKYKGDFNKKKVTIRTGSNSALCGYDRGGTFKTGDIWSIYSSKDFFTTHLSLNKKYDSVDKAIEILDKWASKNLICEDNANFVCGSFIDERCGDAISIKNDTEEPIDCNVQKKTYKNKCEMKKDRASFEYYGECEVKKICTKEYIPVCAQPPMPICPVGMDCIQVMPEQKTYSNKCMMESAGAYFIRNGKCNSNEINKNCKSWFDGCNACNRAKPGGIGMCTKMACVKNKPSFCKEYFEEEVVSKECPLNFPGPEFCDGDIDRVIPDKKDKNGCVISYKCKAGLQILGAPKKEHPSVNIQVNQIIKSPLKIEGNSEGVWFGFEGNLGFVKIVDKNNNILDQSGLNILDNWMTGKSVKFTAELNFKPTTKTGKLIFKNENPSGLKKNDKTFEIPVKFEYKMSPNKNTVRIQALKVKTKEKTIFENVKNFFSDIINFFIFW